MSVIDDLLRSIQPVSAAIPVRDVWVGLHWTAVFCRQMGLAATQSAPCCYTEDVRHVGSLHEQPAADLVEYLRSPNPLEASIGMATFNALQPVNQTRVVELNAADFLLDHSRRKNVALVGHFGFTDKLRQVAAQVSVLELDPAPGDYPAEAAPELLPEADVIGLTASTLLNGSFDRLAALFPPKALVVMLGPTTPLSQVLFDYGVDVLSGSEVTDPAAVLRHLSQGATLRHAPGLRRLTITRQPIDRG